MSKYLVFCYEPWEAGGGWEDYIGTAESPEAALAHILGTGHYVGRSVQLKAIEDLDNPNHHARYLMSRWDEEINAFLPFWETEA